jgi:nitroimidazol reductase NimA-like FMN-containing flavoprotein (pyridoxamine 5'-phosphate oxidase superfamily)
MNAYAPTARSRIKRMPKRARYDRETVHGILDAGFICHVGYSLDGQPYVTPTAHWREGDRVYWHGSSASRMLRSLKPGAVPVCLTVTHVDGLVIARSAFHHSMNYRSVMAFGTAHLVEEAEHKLHALERFVERLYPGRWAELRPVTAQELKATTVLWLDLDEVSAKVRSGPPGDDEADLDWPCWAGVLPLGLTRGQPVPDAHVPQGTALPAYLAQ